MFYIEASGGSSSAQLEDYLRNWHSRNANSGEEEKRKRKRERKAALEKEILERIADHARRGEYRVLLSIAGAFGLPEEVRKAAGSAVEAAAAKAIELHIARIGQLDLCDCRREWHLQKLLEIGAEKRLPQKVRESVCKKMKEAGIVEEYKPRWCKKFFGIDSPAYTNHVALKAEKKLETRKN